MKTKIIMLAFGFALFGFTSANAQGKGHGKYKAKANKEYKKYVKHNRHDDRYERDKRVVYRDKDDDYRRTRRGTVYYPGEIYRHRQSEYYRTNLPPGQAKKIYGHKSAKAFAPGQQKKHYNNVYYPQRRVVYDRRYDDRYNRDNDVVRRLGTLFGL